MNVYYASRRQSYKTISCSSSYVCSCLIELTAPAASQNMLIECIGFITIEFVTEVEFDWFLAPRICRCDILMHSKKRKRRKFTCKVKVKYFPVLICRFLKRLNAENHQILNMSLQQSMNAVKSLKMFWSGFMKIRKSSQVGSKRFSHVYSAYTHTDRSSNMLVRYDLCAEVLMSVE